MLAKNKENNKHISSLPSNPGHAFFSVLCFLFSVLCIILISSTGFTQEKFIYDAKDKRDPFISLVTSDGRLLKLEQETTEGLLLEGIIYDKGGLSYAIVNGAVVKIGDQVNEYQLLKIEED
ncbi:MAG: hypothetical protein KKE91_04595, partial [Candidatus Omnitrophica bacterium]|nr:hypothetical protein [Candidatus Omnitrophota bacterium]